MSKSKGCPFCGATPHHGLGKVQHCQLHGEPFQDFSIWCPHGHAKITARNEERAREQWDTRADELERLPTPTDVADRREAAIEAIAQIEIDREGYPLSRTQQEIYDDAAETFDAIASLIAGPLLEGFVVVPVEPTEAMLRAAVPDEMVWAILRAYWSAMIAARPTGES